jgi:hypothetical protein
MSLAYDTSKAAANHLTTSRANWPSSWLRWSTSIRWPLGGEDRPRSRSKSVNSLEGGEGESRGPTIQPDFHLSQRLRPAAGRLKNGQLSRIRVMERVQDTGAGSRHIAGFKKVGPIWSQICMKNPHC